MSEKKIKVLAYCDSPTCATGFGTVSRNIFEALHKTGRYEIDILGINYWGDPHNFPYRIWPTGTNGENDPYGRRKVCGMMPQMDYDMLFFLQDTFIMDFLPELLPHLKESRQKPFKSISYFPVDGVPKEEWIKNISFPDVKVAYTQFGKNQAESKYPITGVKVINHGVNLNDFNVLPEDQVAAFRQQYFGKHADKFIVMNVNRNQQRKDIPRTLQAFVEFRKQVPESVLYLHMAQNDQGWNLPEVCRAHGLSTTEDVIFPENFGPNQGYPLQIVNALYNASDLVISTCLGEGWGLSWTEAMATKTPVIMPDNTSMSEMITEDKGYLAASGSNASLWSVLPHDNEILRPLVDVDDLVAKMVEVYTDKEGAKAKAEAAYNWVREDLDWAGKIGDQWVKLFDETYAELQEELKVKEKEQAEFGAIETEAV